jgi:hypothetical protein
MTVASIHISAADDDGQLDSELRHLCHIGNHAFDRGTINTEGVVPHQSFTGKFKKNTLIGWLCHLLDSSNNPFRNVMHGHAMH